MRVFVLSCSVFRVQSSVVVPWFERQKRKNKGSAHTAHVHGLVGPEFTKRCMGALSERETGTKFRTTAYDGALSVVFVGSLQCGANHCVDDTVRLCAFGS